MLIATSIVRFIRLIYPQVSFLDLRIEALHNRQMSFAKVTQQGQAEGL